MSSINLIAKVKMLKKISHIKLTKVIEKTNNN